ncbi:hypothetical protein BC937DRAFT_88781 [Endogone sp. FLAS-F59071]|nr:hypothetical protein BC937DRAFT_88781 [Endogone sp. FLAS-F59071]|eukprot:RUS18430.1 hypothetical protein BC937DRAFT_88781 [Endogone sp. FLAS-F59071]
MSVLVLIYFVQNPHQYYKNVVYIIEKFVQKCPPEYKLAGLYVIDAISRAAFEQRRKREKDGATPEPGKFTGEEYLPRFEKVFEENSLFKNLALCPEKDKVAAQFWHSARDSEDSALAPFCALLYRTLSGSVLHSVLSVITPLLTYRRLLLSPPCESIPTSFKKTLDIWHKGGIYPKNVIQQIKKSFDVASAATVATVKAMSGDQSKTAPSASNKQESQSQPPSLSTQKVASSEVQTAANAEHQPAQVSAPPPTSIMSIPASEANIAAVNPVLQAINDFTQSNLGNLQQLAAAAFGGASVAAAVPSTALAPPGVVPPPVSGTAPFPYQTYGRVPTIPDPSKPVEFDYGEDDEDEGGARAHGEHGRHHGVYTLNMVHQAIVRPTQPQPPSQAYDLTVIPPPWSAQPSAPPGVPGTFPRQQFSAPWPSGSNTQQLVPGVVSWRPPAEPVSTSEHAPGTRAANGVGNDTDGGHARDGEWKMDGMVPAPDLPEGSIRVLSRTLFVGPVMNNITKDRIEQEFSKYGKIVNISMVQTSQGKQNAFVKFEERVAAESMKKDKNFITIDGTTIKIGWAYGFGPKEFFDRILGVSIIPLAQLAEHDKKYLISSRRGGFQNQILRDRVTVEEPQVPSGSAAISTPAAPGTQRGSTDDRRTDHRESESVLHRDANRYHYDSKESDRHGRDTHEREGSKTSRHDRGERFDKDRDRRHDGGRDRSGEDRDRRDHSDRGERRRNSREGDEKDADRNRRDGKRHHADNHSRSEVLVSRMDHHNAAVPVPVHHPLPPHHNGFPLQPPELVQSAAMFPQQRPPYSHSFPPLMSGGPFSFNNGPNSPLGPHLGPHLGPPLGLGPPPSLLPPGINGNHQNNAFYPTLPSSAVQRHPTNTVAPQGILQNGSGGDVTPRKRETEDHGRAEKKGGEAGAEKRRRGVEDGVTTEVGRPERKTRWH